MKKRVRSASTQMNSLWIGAGWLLVLLVAYGRLILHPGLHTACPENDTWNLPIRWSVLDSLRRGLLPLWNPNSCFGIPWLATWQTETFYPGTLFFTWLGLHFWNYSGLLHLLIIAAGIFVFLKKSGVHSFGAFTVSVIALLNACAFNHLGSNASMDTMAWMPWIFVSILQIKNKERWAPPGLILFSTLQIFAGYPQIMFYTWIGASVFAALKGGSSLVRKLVLPFLIALVCSACQWLPSAEYFLLHSARLPAVPTNPHFLLPVQNLETFFNPDALALNGVPDYVASPTFFYFNFYSGWMALLILTLGLFRFQKLPKEGRFFLVSFFISLAWCLGIPVPAFDFFHLPFPAFFEPAKAWVLVNLFELFSIGFILESLIPPSRFWKSIIFACVFLELVFLVWSRPLETNLIPPDPALQAEAQKIKSNLGQGRVLILPDAQTHAALYTPPPAHEKSALFKYFLPNSNLFASLPLANFYGSTWPSAGAMDAQLYFEYCFPYGAGNLLDLLGVDLLWVTEPEMPARFKKLSSEGGWSLYKNPGTTGSSFLFYGDPQIGDRKEIFAAFAAGKASAARNLYLNPIPVSLGPRYPGQTPAPKIEINIPDHSPAGFLIRTENALPGWRVWIDGSPAPIYLADGIFQAVSFPAETKKIEFEYEPASFRFGLFLSLFALMGAFAGWRRWKSL